MDNLIESIGRNFSRLLRWAYPGALFLVLLRMSKPEAFKAAAGAVEESLWDLVVVGLVAGFVAYLAQAYVVNAAVSLFFQLMNYDVNVGLQVALPSRDKPRLSLGWLARLMDRHAQAIQWRWGDLTPKGLHRYLDYAWSTYHALFLTGWLTLVFFGIKADNSVFAGRDWEVIVPAALFVLGSLWVYAYLSRVPLGERELGEKK